jgi:small subunit ribosomal protein S16
MVKIRLSRHGNKKNPIYRVVVADSREPRDGKTLEEIGRYNPQLEPSLIEIDTDRANAWIANGAQPTAQVAKLLKIAGRSGA